MPQHRIRVLVVGGSVCGLACAFALMKAGHDVEVFERAPSAQRDASGVRIPPNLSRLLFRWGLGPELVNLASKCERCSFRKMDTGEIVGTMEYRREVMEALEADFWFMDHSDLLQLLYKKAVETGAVVHLGSEVLSIDPEKPSITLATGETFYGDLIIGADGQRSHVRSLIEEAMGEKNEYHASGKTCYTMVVDTEGLESDSLLWDITHRPEWAVHMSANKSVVVHAMHEYKRFAMQMFVPETEDSDEDWERIVPVEKVPRDFIGPGLTKLIERAPHAFQIKFVIRSKVEDWVHPSGKVVIAGEAAHPQLPSSTHSAALAVEDAAVLGHLFSRLDSPNEIETLLYGFQELRQDRCFTIQKSEIEIAHTMWLPDGPEQQARDISLRALQPDEENEEDWGDTEFRYIWERIRMQFAYDPQEEVEEWWYRYIVTKKRADASEEEFSASLYVTIETILRAIDFGAIKGRVWNANGSIFYRVGCMPSIGPDAIMMCSNGKNIQRIGTTERGSGGSSKHVCLWKVRASCM